MKHTSSITNYLDMETKELFNIYSDDKSNKEVRDILIERNLYLVSILAKKYINKGWNWSYFSAISTSSVGHTNVKSAG